MLLTNKDPDNIKHESCIQRFKRIIPKVFQVVSYAMIDLSWKFHENPFMHFTVMLLTDMTPRQVWGPWNSLFRRETV